jgi:hypothetical protein
MFGRSPALASWRTFVIGGKLPNIGIDAQGDRLERISREQGQGEDEIPPPVQEREYRDRDDGRAAHRQDDADEHLPLRSAVDPRSLEHILGQAQHERAQHQDAERDRIARVGQDQAGVGIQQMQLVVQDEQRVGDHDRRQDLRDEQPADQQAGDPEPVPGQRVRGRQRDRQREDRGAEPDDQAGQHVAALDGQHGRVVGQCPARREEVVVRRGDKLAVRLERSDDHRVQREQQDDEGGQRGDAGERLSEITSHAVSPRSDSRLSQM